MPSIIGDLYETGRDRDNIDREIQKIKERKRKTFKRVKKKRKW